MNKKCRFISFGDDGSMKDRVNERRDFIMKKVGRRVLREPVTCKDAFYDLLSVCLNKPSAKWSVDQSVFRDSCFSFDVLFKVVLAKLPTQKTTFGILI